MAGCEKSGIDGVKRGEEARVESRVEMGDEAGETVKAVVVVGRDA